MRPSASTRLLALLLLSLASACHQDGAIVDPALRDLRPVFDAGGDGRPTVLVNPKARGNGTATNDSGGDRHGRAGRPSVGPAGHV